MVRHLRGILTGTLVVGLVGFVSGVGTYAAFFSKTSNGNVAANRMDAGTVDLVDDDGGSVMFDLSGMRPTDPPRQACIKVRYDGSLASTVGLYATFSASSLAPYVDVIVEAGDGGGFGGCSGFAPRQTLYSGALGSFPTAYGSVFDPDPSWTTGESHSYRFTVALQNTPSAQGLAARVTFTWEARNL